MRVLIGGVDVTAAIQPGSLDISDEMNARNTLHAVLRDVTTLVRIPTGEDIRVDGDGSPPPILFAGTIEEPSSNLLPPGEVVDIAITAVDYNQLADRFLVAEVYENQTIEAITTDLVTQYLGTEGVTIGHIEPGAVITRKLFSYVSLAEALNWVSEQTGYAWEIDYSKVFRLRAPDTIAAPFAATGDTVRTMSVRRPRGAYRNRQYIRGGKDLTDLRAEFFSGDGTRRTFTVAFPIGKEPSVTVNGTPESVGIRGVEFGFAWYWNKESNEITQDNAGTILEAADQLGVTYRGLFPILVQAQDDAALAERIAVEGGSGLYEAIEEEGSIDDAELALDTALAKLQRDGLIRDYIEITTDLFGMRSGQLMTVTDPALGLDGTYLIQSVRVSDVDGVELLFSATLMSGDALGGWIAWFQRLMAVKRLEVAEDTESLLLLRTLPDVVALTDALVTLFGQQETRIAYARIGQSEIGITQAPVKSAIFTETLRMADIVTALRIGGSSSIEATVSETIKAHDLLSAFLVPRELVRIADTVTASRTSGFDLFVFLSEALRGIEDPAARAQLSMTEFTRFSDVVTATRTSAGGDLSASVSEGLHLKESPTNQVQDGTTEAVRVSEDPGAMVQLETLETVRIADTVTAVLV